MIGLGYVGLPLAMAFAGAGFHVVGIDIDERRIGLLTSGRSHVGDVSDSAVGDAVRRGLFRATSDYDALSEASVIFVSVPTPSDSSKAPDLRAVTAAAEGIASRLRDGQLVILESTTFPGTTDEVLRPILERGGKRAGVDFYLAFSPERIDPGNKRYGISNTPKVVGGVDGASTALAAHVLEQVVTEGSVFLVSSTRVAEFTKLLENTFRAVNIAFVNEIAMLCERMDIDVWEVIRAASTKPYGFMPFRPGPGVGGHCIPVDPYYLSWKARQYDFPTKFIDLAAETNLEMPFYTVDRMRRFLGRHGRALHGSDVLVLGAAFKKDVEDARNSAAIRVMEILAGEGAAVRYHDPFVPEIILRLPADGPGGEERALRSIALDEASVASADLVAILVGHSAVDYGAVLRAGTLVFDAVDATAGHGHAATVERL